MAIIVETTFNTITFDCFDQLMAIILTNFRTLRALNIARKLGEIYIELVFLTSFYIHMRWKTVVVILEIAELYVQE